MISVEPDSAFNSLSRDHGESQKADDRHFRRYAFNSLSRDHALWVGRARGGALHFQLPLSGSRSHVDHAVLQTPPVLGVFFQLPLSGSPEYSGADVSYTATSFQLPLSGSRFVCSSLSSILVTITLSTPSLGITKLRRATRGHFANLSTPSLGITRLDVADENVRDELPDPFNSLSRDHINIISYVCSVQQKLTFNSLSRDHKLRRGKRKRRRR